MDEPRTAIGFDSNNRMFVQFPPHGVAIIALSPDEMRSIASRLNKEADLLEQSADQSTVDVLAKIQNRKMD